MVKKDIVENPIEDVSIDTEESSIEHINKLIADPNEEQDLVVKEEDKNYEDAEGSMDDKEDSSDDYTSKDDSADGSSDSSSDEPEVKKPRDDLLIKPIKPLHKSTPTDANKIEHKIMPKKENKNFNIKTNNNKTNSIKTNTKPIIKTNIKPMKKPLERPKMVKHKMEHKRAGEARTEKRQKNEGSLLWLWIAIAVIVLVAVAVVIYKTSYTAKQPVPVSGNQTVNLIAATVNGDPIYLNDIDVLYARQSPAGLISKEELLNQSIDKTLLLQEAKSRNVLVSSDDIQTAIDNIKLQQGIDDTQLNTLLAQQNLTLKDLQTLITNQLLVRNLLNETILNNISVTGDEIQKYYADNIDKFKTPEQVKAQHILILTTGNVTDAEAHAKILEVNNSLNDSNFCELVTKYSEDTGSLKNCGIYTFGRGEMVQEFENAAFNLSINQTAIVKTVYGWHLIKKLDSINAGTVALSNVTALINQTIHDNIAQTNFDNFMVGLRAKATIVNYLVKQPEQNASTTATQTTVTPTTVTITPKNLDSFAQCLTNKSVVFYGAYWCPHCQSNKELFGDSVKYVNYVECGVEGNPQLQTQQCQDAGITGYPTWLVNGKKLAGEQTLENLAQLTGCTLPQ